MAIAVDAIDGGGSGSGATWSHTVTGTNTFLWVSTIGGIGTDNVTAVSYNGVSMTKVGSALTSGDRYSTGWYLINPATGTHNIVITGGAQSWGVGVSYTGVEQSSPIDASNTFTFTSQTTGTTTLTATNAGDWGLTAIWQNPITVVAGTNSFLRNSNTPFAFDSNGTVGSTGSFGMTINSSGGATNWAVVMVLIKPAAVAATNTNFLMHMQ